MKQIYGRFDGMSRLYRDSFFLNLHDLFHANRQRMTDIGRDLCGNYQRDAEKDEVSHTNNVHPKGWKVKSSVLTGEIPSSK